MKTSLIISVYKMSSVSEAGARSASISDGKRLETIISEDGESADMKAFIERIPV